MPGAHGLQVDGENYILPVNADIERKADLDWHAVKVSTILRDIEGPGRTSIIILDACRDNPLTRKLRALNAQNRSMNVGRGLARMTARAGSYIAFATSPDDVAADGTGANSPFTTALVKHIDSPGLDIARLMRRVRRDVQRVTNGQQTPWSNSSLVTDFTFRPAAVQVGKPPPSAIAPPRIAPKPARPRAGLSIPDAWRETQKIGTCAAYRVFADSFPAHFYARLARVWQEKNCRSGGEAKIAVPRHEPPPPSVAQPEAKSKVIPKQATDAREKKVARLETEPLAAAPAASPPPPQPDRAELTRKIQTRLKALGCYTGRIDGIWGKRSQAALEEAIEPAAAGQGVSAETLAALNEKPKRLRSERAPDAIGCEYTDVLYKPDRPRPKRPKTRKRERLMHNVRAKRC